MITQNDISQLVQAARLANFAVDNNDLTLLEWTAGLGTHIPAGLPHGFAAVYIFRWNEVYLKVGKANLNSNARYQSHHYNPNSSNSNLSKSLINNAEFHELIGILTPSEWIRTNSHRYNILIPADIGTKFVNFAEAFFILKCNPLFEGN